MAFRRRKQVQPFVSHSNVADMERNTDHQPYNEEAVRDWAVSGTSSFLQNPSRPPIMVAPRARRDKGIRGTSMRGGELSPAFAPRGTHRRTQVSCRP